METRDTHSDESHLSVWEAAALSPCSCGVSGGGPLNAPSIHHGVALSPKLICMRVRHLKTCDLHSTIKWSGLINSTQP